MRKVFIKQRVITFLLPELKWQPLTIDLDKLDEQKEEIEKMSMDQETLEKISKLRTEEEIFNDIKKDFQLSGWRLLNK